MDIKFVNNFRVMLKESIDGYQERLNQMKKDHAPVSEISYVEKCIANFVAMLDRERPE